VTKKVLGPWPTSTPRPFNALYMKHSERKASVPPMAMR